VIAAALFVFTVRGVLAPFVIAGMLAYILVPGVESVCARFRLRRGMVVPVLFLCLLAALGLGIAAIEPALVRESKDLVQNAPGILTSLFVQVLGSERVEVLGTTLEAGPMADRLLAAAREALGRPTEALHMAEAALRGVLDVLLILIVLFYLMLDWDKLVGFAFRLVPADRRQRVGALASSIHLVWGVSSAAKCTSF
jgi:predicted PurR-regulated permease PerM